MTDPDPLEQALEHLPAASEQRGVPGHDTASELSKAIRALTLRIGGASYAAIADTMGYSDPAAARNLVMRALGRREAEKIDELRAVENARLDADEAEVRLIIGNRAIPHGTRLRAVDTRTRLSARRARLNGLDAPMRVEVSASIREELHAALAELEEAATSVVRGEVLDVTDEPYEERDEA